MSALRPHRRLAGAALALCAFACAPALSQDNALSARADALLADILDRDGGPGVMAAVAVDGEIVWSGAAGMADLEAGVALTPETRLRIGSVSKTITAALILRLAEQELIDLDADIRTLVPELTAPARGAITPRLIAAHLSGIRQYDFSDYLDANNVYFYPTLTEALARIAGDPLVHQPGEAHLYTSIGFNALGVAAERASGLSFEDAVARDVTGPLGLADTLIDHPLNIIARRSRFYTRFPDGVTRNTIWRDSSDYYPSGGMLSTAQDLVRFTAATFDGDWLSSNSRALLTQEAQTEAGAPTGYSFGWQVERDDAGAIVSFSHGGETNGAYALVRYFPETRLAVAGVMNANFATGEPYFFEAVGEVLPEMARCALSDVGVDC